MKKLERVLENPNSPLERLVRSLMRLPGIGEKSATRLGMFILRDRTHLIADLTDSLMFTRDKVCFCKICQNLTEDELCLICRDAGRDVSVICVVQEPMDIVAIEKIGEYRGAYHVLHGAISPMEGVGPDLLQIESLIMRIKSGTLREVILATNPNPEGETTALYLKKILQPFAVKITRIASGIPVGGTLEYTDLQTLARSIDNRKEF